MTQKSETSIEELKPIIDEIVRKLAISPERYGVDHDDVAQEVWMKAFRYWDKFKGDCKVETWLHTMTRNILINYDVYKARKCRKNNGTVSSDEEFIELEDTSGSLEEFLMTEEKLQIVQDLYENLENETQRDIFEMLIEGWDAVSMSKELDIPYHRIRKNISQIYKIVDGRGTWYTSEE